jgi:A/G-specific adenine glycosylase
MPAGHRSASATGTDLAIFDPMAKANPLPEVYFAATLMHWHRHHNRREMPWKNETDPYKIWLSEVILQQTQVAQGRAYYLRFIGQYPTVRHLAAAPNADVYKLWEGLGYYSRCKNLLVAARQVVELFGGTFPASYHQLLLLKGVGTYTAAAIASFAFGLPHAVVDGNVLRLLSRFFNITIAIDATEGKNYFSKLAQTLLQGHPPAAYNQAIMDFGATVCKPKQPACGTCVLHTRCQAYAQHTVALLPLKAKKLIKKVRWFCYLWLANHDGTAVLARQRGPGDVWENLWEFLLIAHQESFYWTAEAYRQYAAELLGAMPTQVVRLGSIGAQQLTHQQINLRFVQLQLSTIAAAPAGYAWVPRQALQKLAWPRALAQYLKADQNGAAHLF